MAGSDRLMRDPPLILIVDDNADNREILEARLASQGYRTALAIDGEEALASGSRRCCRTSCSST